MPKKGYIRTKPPWNKNLTKETDIRVAKVGEKVRKALKNKPKNHKINCQCFICKSKRHEYRKHKEGCQCYTCKQKRHEPRKPHTKRSIRKMSLSHGGTGIPGELSEHGIEFDNALREQVRFRDKYTCRLCGCSQLENGKQLNVHHIDYNKMNNILSNLTSLCTSCHSKTNYNRDY